MKETIAAYRDSAVLIFASCALIVLRYSPKGNSSILRNCVGWLSAWTEM